ncbi:MAG: antibiotic biosynthesis monooxygenase [Bacillota bacterium]|nr:antibiotic biosynthesis monooxygenase [Bacillota bacterium]MDW7684505.1 antibiotic biosynthesis monooxygenase [Bacillota bacterium]
MVVSLVMFNLGKGKKSAAEDLADQFAMLHKNFKGLKSLTFFSDENTGDYGSFSIWESQEALDAAVANYGFDLHEALSAVATAPPTIKTFAVYEPKV